MKRYDQILSGLIFRILALCLLPVAIAYAATNQHSGSEHTPHWGYAGAGNPSEWGSLSNAYALCSSGKRQSPVDIWNEVSEDLYPLQFQYQSIPLLVVNNGHTLQANYNTLAKQETVSIGGKSYPVQTSPVYNSKLMLGDVTYKLLQFHFHTPSEHAREGVRYPMEVHLVHKSADGNLAVVGIFLKLGSENPTLKKIIGNVSSEINKVNAARDVTINAADLLPSNHQHFHYNGSLTTPPCSENVNWLVMKTPIEVSDTQVKQFLKLIGENARLLQPMHWRSVLSSD
jgi:carbonic anhydrase